MAARTKWQQRQKAAADRAYAWWDFLRGERHNRVKVRRAWFIMGEKESAPIRKRR